MQLSNEKFVFVEEKWESRAVYFSLAREEEVSHTRRVFRRSTVEIRVCQKWGP